jgi:hypothetical protein
LAQTGAYAKAARNECPVDSSAVTYAGYNGDTQELTITFTGGRSYAYQGVSPQRYRAFCEAGSKGRYVNALIKGAYSFRRL